MRVIRRRPVAVLVAVALAAACSSADPEADPPASSTSAPVPPTTTTVVLPDPVPIAWTDCGGRFRCATLTVPIDYHDPAGPTLQVAVIQRPAGDPAQRIGTLVMNPGGPGASGVRRVRRGFQISAEVAERFDIVGFDPRGVGESAPITCGSTVPAFRALDLAPDTPEEQAALEASAAAVAAECAQTEGDRLAHLGTIDVARDLEVLRRALGEERISFVGLSYGTLLGQLWAEAYPGSVRSLVLDGVVDPSDITTGTSLEQLRAIDETLSDIDAACAADSSCPTTADGGVTAAYDQLAARLEGGVDENDGVGPTQLTYAFFMATYGSERWPELWAALHAGLRGDLSGVAALARSFTNLVSYAPFAILSCLDSPHPVGPEEWRLDADGARERSPRFGAALANELLPCAYLPSSGIQPHRVRAPGTPPILVVGSTGDVATPYEKAVAVAERLDSGFLLTVEIQGHIAIGASDCADAAITRYLVDGAIASPVPHCKS